VDLVDEEDLAVAVAAELVFRVDEDEARDGRLRLPAREAFRTVSQESGSRYPFPVTSSQVSRSSWPVAPPLVVGVMMGSGSRWFLESPSGNS
jgi:hypothetical protein